MALAQVGKPYTHTRNPSGRVLKRVGSEEAARNRRGDVRCPEGPDDDVTRPPIHMASSLK